MSISLKYTFVNTKIAHPDIDYMADFIFIFTIVQWIRKKIATVLWFTAVAFWLIVGSAFFKVRGLISSCLRHCSISLQTKK